MKDLKKQLICETISDLDKLEKLRDSAKSSDRRLEWAIRLVCFLAGMLVMVAAYLVYFLMGI
jgi:hypothetical protein